MRGASVTRVKASIVLVAALVGNANAGSPRVSIETKVSKATAESTLTVDKVNAKLKASYRSHIERCYRDRFDAKATAKAKAAGALRLAFGVEPDGKTSGIIVASFDKKLDACVAKRVKTWRFDIPKDKNNKAIATGFAFELALAPMARRDSVEMTEAEAARFADMMRGEGTIAVLQSDISMRGLAHEYEVQPHDTKKVVAGGGRSGGGISTGTGPKISAPTGRISVSSKAALDRTSLTLETALEKVLTAYMPGLKRCYANVLQTKPTLSGRVRLAFTVGVTGTTMKATASTPEPAMSTCMQKQMASWRFPIPKDGETTTTARFEVGLTIVPD